MSNSPKFISSDNYKNKPRVLIEKKQEVKETLWLKNLEEVFDKLNIVDGMTLSFHHHLRNGDYVLNDVAKIIKKRNLKNISIAASSIFPNNKCLVELIEEGNITNIYTNYMNGPVSEAVVSGKLKGELIMNTHGGRARSIESGEIKIDVAFIATPTVDKFANGTGSVGKAACGSIGYAIPDSLYAKKVVLVTDNVVKKLDSYELDGKLVDIVCEVSEIGDSNGIVSGTTKITKNPTGLKIARDAAKFLDEIGLIKEGFSMQTGAGGTSLAVAYYVRKIMEEKKIKGSFATGGITGYFVNMLEDGLLDELYDVQCFDLDAIRSYNQNQKHHGMGASMYANPYDENVIVNKLDFVILGATEIDLDFNVNVTTDSHGNVIGGSGGHSDTAHGANVTVIVTNLIKSRMPIIKEHVTTITTPGSDIDVLVCERGIAINPKRTDLIEKVKDSKLKICTIEQLLELAHTYTGKPNEIQRSNEVVGEVMYRDGSIIDYIYKK